MSRRTLSSEPTRVLKSDNGGATGVQNKASGHDQSDLLSSPHVASCERDSIMTAKVQSATKPSTSRVWKRPCWEGQLRPATPLQSVFKLGVV